MIPKVETDEKHSWFHFIQIQCLFNRQPDQFTFAIVERYHFAFTEFRRKRGEQQKYRQNEPQRPFHVFILIKYMQI